MSEKKYTTPDQREILGMAGIPHRPGRTFEEADSLIDAYILHGNLPKDIKDRATIRQRAKLDKLGIQYGKSISKAEASDLIDRNSPPTEPQLAFLKELGVEISPGLTKKSASDLLGQHTENRLMSEAQARFIGELGGVVDRSMTLNNATLFIDYLLENEQLCSRCDLRVNRSESRCQCGAYLPKRALLKPPKGLLKGQKTKPWWAFILECFGLD